MIHFTYFRTEENFYPLFYNWLKAKYVSDINRIELTIFRRVAMRPCVESAMRVPPSEARKVVVLLQHQQDGIFCVQDCRRHDLVQGINEQLFLYCFRNSTSYHLSLLFPALFFLVVNFISETSTESYQYQSISFFPFFLFFERERFSLYFWYSNDLSLPLE